MWHTSLGDRALSGAEAQLVITSTERIIGSLEIELHDLDDDCALTTGVELFDCQSLHQRIALVNEVCRHLLSPSAPALELNAEREATVMAIFEMVKSIIEAELNESRYLSDTACEYRKKVLAAFDYRCPESSQTLNEGEDDEDLPDPWCDELEAWEWVIESLADRVLWDRDFEMAEMIVDEDPEMADAYKQVLGIQHDYFSSAPPEVEEREALNVLDELRRFLDLPVRRRKPR